LSGYLFGPVASSFVRFCVVSRAGRLYGGRDMTARIHLGNLRALLLGLPR